MFLLFLVDSHLGTQCVSLSRDINGDNGRTRTGQVTATDGLALGNEMEEPLSVLRVPV